jgi:hypothetical protein
LVEGFAGAAVTLQHLNTQLALGQPIDLSQPVQAVSAMVRVASRLGLQRRARDVLARQPSRGCLCAASSTAALARPRHSNFASGTALPDFLHPRAARQIRRPLSKKQLRLK